MRAFPEADAPDASGWAYVRNKVADGVRREQARAMRYAVKCKTLEIKTRVTPDGPHFYDVVTASVIIRLVEGQMKRVRNLTSICTFMHFDDAEEFVREAQAERFQRLSNLNPI